MSARTAPDQRRRCGRSAGAQPVEDALGDVGVQPDAGVQRGEQRVLHDDAGQHVLQVVRRVLPAISPPNTYVNSSTNMIGCT